MNALLFGSNSREPGRFAAVFVIRKLLLSDCSTLPVLYETSSAEIGDSLTAVTTPSLLTVTAGRAYEPATPGRSRRLTVDVPPTLTFSCTASPVASRTEADGTPLASYVKNGPSKVMLLIV